MERVGELEVQSATESLIDWWAMAGVTNAVAEEPVNWLQPARPPASPVAQIAELEAAAPAWPQSLDAFHDWLAADGGLPELAWPQMSGRSRRILPVGQRVPSLMVVCDMPDPEDMETGTLLSGEAGKLFDAMLAVIGSQRSDVYLSSLAVARPAGGIISENDAAQLANRMRHHMALVAPRQVLVMGDKASRALLPTVDAGNIIGLRPLNHQGGILNSVAIMHPRVLLKQPTAKMQVWRQLQLLKKAQAE